jgi:membrane-bound ClpP family serine protease
MPSNLPARQIEDVPAGKAPAAEAAIDEQAKENAQADKDAPADKPLLRAGDQERVGRLVRIPATITSNIEARVVRVARALIAQAKQRDQWPVLVFEFEPGKADFGKAYDLADDIASLTGATTVAYVPATVKGHMLLPIMACDQIVMAADAQIGEAGIDEKTIGVAKRSAYVDIANRRRTIPADLALGMLDPELEVWEVETEVSREFVLSSRIDELKKQKTFDLPERPLIPKGEAGLFTGREARALGFVSYLAEDRNALAKALGLSRDALEEDPSLDGGWRAMRVQIKGQVTPQLATQTQRIIQDAIAARDVNFICVWIDSPGGSPESSVSLANYLASLESDERRTVAYIPSEARADAAYIALACDHIVMHPEAVFGGAGASQLEAADIELTVRPLEEIARKKLRSPSLAAALVDPNLAVYRYTREADGAVQFMSEVEVQRQAQPQDWKQGARVTEPGRLLKLDGAQAVEFAMADDVVESFNEFKRLYGLEQDPQLIEPGWADTLIDALRSPGVTWFLLLLGGAALYAELQSPGVGVGAFVSAVCFLLFFWGNYLGGTAGWLEVLLFGLGVICILLEIFVLPGAGIFGLGGAALVLASVILATQTFVGLPQNEYQAAELQRSLMIIAGAGVGLVALISVMHRYLPRAPVFNRMVLEPPTDLESAQIAHNESLAHYEHFVGRRGTALTPLMPAGKAQFDGELLNVIADGEFIERGQEIEVAEVRGSRVVVRTV